ncbi:MAG: TrkH family potassium uptake protein [Lachnospiraceae bacterium]|nr:TrkH family potassium uptake protein [Lachnospiraceae bacterium]
MNNTMIRFILGQILRVEAALLLLPCVTSLIYREAQGQMYLFVAALCLVSGLLMTTRKPKNTVFYLKEGCVATALSWIFLSLFGCLPFVLTGEIPSFTDALFETVSGFTTTGTSILPDIEALSHTSLMWRSFTHWIGGMGVLVFLLAIVSLSGGSDMNLMRAESPGPSVEKLVPKIRSSAAILYGIYFAMTILEMILLACGGMPIFESIMLAFGTAGTGGFAIKNDSLASATAYQQWVITIFMILFGVNFNAYYLILFRKFKKAIRMEEVRYYLMIITVSILIVFLHIRNIYGSIGISLRHAAFQVASIITTTGFVTTDFDAWHENAKAVLLLLMFIGACAGSTGGGIKVSRIVLLFKSLFKELYNYIHPKNVRAIWFDKRPMEKSVVRSTLVYFMTFMLLFFVSVFAITFEGYDFMTSFSSVAATINNIGPGMSLAGPTENFAYFSVFSKYVFMFDMLVGRLELFPMLILLYPGTWKELFPKGRSNPR